MNHHRPREAISGAIFFASTDDFFAALFGPPQHDAHVGRRRTYLDYTAKAAAWGAAMDRLTAEVKARSGQ